MRLMPSRPFHYYSLPLSLLSLGGSIDGGVSQNRLINSPINPTTRYRSGNAACHSGLSVVSRLASGLIFTFFFLCLCLQYLSCCRFLSSALHKASPLHFPPVSNYPRSYSLSGARY